MTQSEYQYVIDELDRLIIDSRALMKRFEATGMEKKMAQDYQLLEDNLVRALKDQRRYTLAMLEADGVFLPSSMA
ncbi:hypothetical protein FGL86_15095 [Pistricoccus aurantiacus]|uniref:Uncharacterized protein n=1 Tax=Pistricoccus aurantiacus TaxID=1883414 RepID=A0A5B8SVX5_9GAMM|nr:hypothetical protein [Pistricoccus aurantiacus]QEA40277.1 hypothetical protein FGL86_15095 [Pistricoccus aurantiacus]